MRWNNPTLVCALLALSVGLASPALAQSDSRKGLRDRASSASGELSAELELREVRVQYQRLKAVRAKDYPPKSRELLKRAGESLVEADAALARGLQAKAQHFAYRAQRLLARAEQAAQRSKGRDVQLEDQIAELTELIQRTRSRSSTRKSPMAVEMLKRAETNLKAAREAYRQGDRQKARRYLRAGRRAILRSMEQSGG